MTERRFIAKQSEALYIATHPEGELRRVIKPQPTEWGRVKFTDSTAVRWKGNVYVLRDLAELCPYGQVGDRLWVREKWRGWFAEDEDGRPVDGYWRVRYAADGIERLTGVEWDEGPGQVSAHDAGLDTEPSRWKSSIFMPREFSRFTLEITRLKADRGELWDWVIGYRRPEVK